MMKNNLLRGWNLMRVLRLIVGIVVIIQGIQANEWIIIIMGGLFSFMPLFNIAYCNTGNCGITTSHSPQKTTEDIHYEEVK